jgi:hypothetical protein
MQQQQADNKEVKFLDWQTFYLNLLKAKCNVCPVCQEKFNLIPLSVQYGKDPWYREDQRPIAPPSVIDLFPSMIDRLSGSTIEACKKSRRNRQFADALSHKFSTNKPSIPLHEAKSYAFASAMLRNTEDQDGMAWLRMLVWGWNADSLRLSPSWQTGCCEKFYTPEMTSMRLQEKDRGRK